MERLTKAQDKLVEAQKELNEVTAKTPENLLEIAMAKKELDDALTNLNALGAFEDAMAQLVESTGMKLQDLINMANCYCYWFKIYHHLLLAVAVAEMARTSKD